jgi:P27 family predicted phage terminase small subunit
LDEASFAVLCVTWENMCELRQVMAREGQILVSPRGRRYQHPAIAIYKAELHNFSELIKAFGLAPLARHRIPAMENGAKSDDPLDELLHRHTSQRRLQ